MFEPNVFGEFVKSVLQLGFGHRLFNAKLETIPQQLIKVRWQGFSGAEVVKSCLARFVQIVEFGSRHRQKCFSCGFPKGKGGVNPTSSSGQSLQLSLFSATAND